MGFAAVTVGLFFILIYATGLRPSPPRHARGSARRSRGGPTADRPLLVSRPGTYGGILATIVAATGLAGIAPSSGPGGRIVLLLVFVLGAVVALGRGSGLVREVVYIGIGVSATLTALVELHSGACGAVLPSRAAAVFAVFPLVALVLSSLFLARWGGRRGSVMPDLGPLCLAAFAIVELGTFAAYPAGVPAFDTAVAEGRTWLPLGLLLLLGVIATGVGMRPRVGADLAALGLLALTTLFLFYQTPCGLHLTPLFVVSATFGTSFGIVRMLRNRSS